jgi:hypothetical protein
MVRQGRGNHSSELFCGGNAQDCRVAHYPLRIAMGCRACWHLAQPALCRLPTGSRGQVAGERRV